MSNHFNTMSHHANTMKILLLLLFSIAIIHNASAQNLGRVQTRHITLYPQGALDLTDTLGWLLTATTNGGHQWNWPDANGSANNILITDGGTPANLSWNSGSGLFILNQNAIHQTANFDISGSGNIQGNLNVGGLTQTYGLFITSATAGVLYNDGSSGTNGIPQTNGQLLIGKTGLAPIAALPIAGPGIYITPGAGTLEISSDQDSSGTGFIHNQYTAQTSAGFNVVDAGAAKTSAFTEATISNIATSSTGSIPKVVLSLRSSGAWSGLGDAAFGLTFDMTGAPDNTDLLGTNGNWFIDATGDASLASLTIGSPLAMLYGGTGQSTQQAAIDALTAASGATPTYVLTTDGTHATWGAPGGGGMTNPMTTYGDIIYEDGTPAPARLAGNTNNYFRVLTQKGSGSVSGVPAWSNFVTNIGLSESVFVGTSGTLTASTGDFNTGIGVGALYTETAGSGTGSFNTGIGWEAGYGLGGSFGGSNNIAVGVTTLVIPGGNSYNIAIGTNAANAVSSDSNIAIGTNALLAGGTSGNCIAIGNNALSNGLTYGDNIAIGSNTLYNVYPSGTQNVAVGSYAGPTSHYSNTTSLGYLAHATASNTVQLGNTSVTNVNTSGVIQTGIVSSTTGGVVLANASSSHLTTIQAGNATAAVTYTLPLAAPGTAGYLLASTTTGGLSWVAPGGGTGTVTSVDVAIPGMTSSGAITTSGTITMSGQLAIANGGTAAATTSQNYAFIGPTSGSGAPSFRALVAGDIPALSYLTNPMTTKGDMIYEDATPTPVRLAIGSNTNLLTITSGIPAWEAIPTWNQNTTGTANIAGGTAGAIPYQSAANTTTVLAATATANKVLMSGASAAPTWSTPTFPNASATTRKIIVSDGTNWTASTETYATPSTSGNVMTSDGTNWTSAANEGGWTSVFVSGSNFTRTAQTLATITGLSFTPAASTTYEVEGTLYTTSSSSAGNEFGFSSGGSGETGYLMFTGMTSATAASSVATSTSGTAEGTAFMAVAASGIVKFWGVFSSGTGSPSFAMEALKVTSGTCTVIIGSKLRYRILGQ